MIIRWIQKTGETCSNNFCVAGSLWVGVSGALGFCIFLCSPPSVVDIPVFHTAYIGPGAGFAFLGSFLSLLVAFFVGAASLLVWPFRFVWRVLTRRKGMAEARVKKVIFLGMDGLDPDLCERYIRDGKMPHLSRLRDAGHFSHLRTTFPPLSPVAWSTFATGVNPGKHAMYDFLNRSIKTYLPELSSSRVEAPKRFLNLGNWLIPISKPRVELRRKSRTFWNILSEHQVDCTVLRVPITFPPEKFEGKLLSAMCTPDLLGTQGSFMQFTTALEEASYEQGKRYPLKRRDDRFHGVIMGPGNPVKRGNAPMTIEFSLDWNATRECGLLKIQGGKYTLQKNEYSPWIKLNFKAGLGVKIQGITQFLVTETEPNFSVYLTPINIDPEAPALPISHPKYYATYLAKLLGAYSTLGLAEDTWALNERVIDEQGFLDQAYSIYSEREKMFFNALDKAEQGVVACVFDTSDRIQHMFFRYLEPDHPAHKDNGTDYEKYANVIEDLYCRMDDLVGRTMSYVDDDTVLFVLSDHGFKSFQRGVNLNVWLLQNGYLQLRQDASPGEPYLRNVDWSKTRAYVFGLAGVYINQKGREGQGIVEPGEEADTLKRELADKLSGLIDEQRNTTAICKAYPSYDVYKGPYLSVAPDVVIGYADQYRNSWAAALGTVTSEVFEDNCKAWSGDHCVDPPRVPGVLFSNRAFRKSNPGIEDLAPTTLSLFGVKPPPYMDGTDLQLTEERESV